MHTDVIAVDQSSVDVSSQDFVHVVYVEFEQREHSCKALLTMSNKFRREQVPKCSSSLCTDDSLNKQFLKVPMAVVVRRMVNATSSSSLNWQDCICCCACPPWAITCKHTA